MLKMSGQVLCLFISCFPKLLVRSKWWSEGGYQGRVAINWVTSPPGMAVRQSGCARGIAIITHQVHSHPHHIVTLSYHHVMIWYNHSMIWQSGNHAVQSKSKPFSQHAVCTARQVVFSPINFSEVSKSCNADSTLEEYIRNAKRFFWTNIWRAKYTCCAKMLFCRM